MPKKVYLDCQYAAISLKDTANQWGVQKIPEQLTRTLKTECYQYWPFTDADSVWVD